MNINQMVDDQKDKLASSGKPLNPGAGPDLIEVLATRKLLEEKQAAARDLAMKQQQNPGTIAEQQEQQLLGLTQKEVANQTGGILAQRAQQQQKRPPQQGGIMGAMGGGKPPMPQGARPPMPQGAPRPPMGGAPRPPMGGMPSAMGGARPPMMASGGIVGYNQGGGINAVVANAQREVQALGGTVNPDSSEYQAGLQRIMQTLTAQSSPEEKEAIKKVLTTAGLKETPLTVDHINYNMGSPFGGGAGSPAHGDLIKKQIDERGAMAIVDQAMMLGGLGAVRQIAVNVGKKYVPKVVNYAKQKLAKGKDFVRTPATKPKYKMGADGKPVMTAPGQAASPNTGNLTGAMLGLGGLAYGADAVMGGTKDMGGAGVLRPETDQKSVDQKLIDDTNRDAIAQYGSKDGPSDDATMDDATRIAKSLGINVPDDLKRDALNTVNANTASGTTDSPKIGGSKTFDFTPKDIGKTEVSDALGDEFNTQLKARMAQDPAKQRDAVVKEGKADTQQKVGGLQELLDRDMDESRRLAKDPYARYQRDKASIYAARLGDKGREYQRNLLEEQQGEQRLIRQEISNYKDITNTELNLMKDVDAKAAKLFEQITNDVNNSMNTQATIAAADREDYRQSAMNRIEQLSAEADAAFKERKLGSLSRANDIAATSASNDQLENLLKVINTIETDKLELVINDYSLVGDEKDAALAQTRIDLDAMYSPLKLAIAERLKQNLGISPSSNDGDDDMTDEEAALVNQFK